MEKLLQRAKEQRVINSLDFKRLSRDTDPDTLKEILTVIDSINGIKVASLFGDDETVLDRSELQGGINSQDYGKLSRDDKGAIPVRGIMIDDRLETVGSQARPIITRAKFDSLSNIQKEDALKKNTSIVDKLPAAHLKRDQLHEITLRVSQQTKDKIADYPKIDEDGDEDGKEA